jgi:hypothetical protein
MRSRNLALLAFLAASFAPAAHAQTAESAFSFHAAINAAGGVSGALPILGVPSYGTFDYRTAALQFRYKLDAADQFVVQLVNRRLGVSPLQAALPEVSLQWAYWQRRGDFGTIKVGRDPMPRGLFNEVRFVGTVLPFFRPSFEVYGEGRETVDGFVYTNTKRFGDASIELNAFGGSNEVRTQVVTATGNSIRAFRGNALMGTQVWLNLAPGQTRIGGYFAQYRIDSAKVYGMRQEVLASAETHLVPRTTLRAEGLHIYGKGPNQDRLSAYGQGVVNLTEQLDLMSELSVTKNRIFQSAPLSNVDVIATRDLAVGLTYRLGGGALVRVERHEVHGYAFDQLVPLVSTVAGKTVIAPPSGGMYWLGSFAFSF